MYETESGTGQVRSQVQDTAAQVQDKVRDTAQEAKSQAGDRVREQVDTRSTQAGEQVQSVAQAMRQSGEQLRGQQKDGAAKLVEGSAQRMERLGSYLEQSNADDILQEVEDFARRQPWAVAAGAFAVGLVASRFLKASSSRRYQQSDAYRFARRTPYEDMPLTRAGHIAAPDLPPAAVTESPSVTRPQGY
jgi:ElaB/YqjD/DUF883 family membrane-anchored ribosome-binding protein